jgi:ABC-type uncharacterized transport system involved in gliding motility auxiliary subunit
MTRAINFGASGRLSVTPSPDIAFEELVWTSADAMTISAQTAGREVTPKELMKDYAGQGVQQVLAGRLNGRLTSSFTNNIPPFEVPDDPVQAALVKNKATDLQHLETSNGDVDIILVADTDLFDDSFYVSPNGRAPVADNATFILNALDNLSGSAALVNLRSRAPSTRLMTRVETMRESARERLYDEQETLQLRLQQTEARLDALREAGAAGGLLANIGEDADVDQAEAEELARFRSEAVEIRSRLRDIEREFRSDIDDLELKLAVLNIWIPPMLVLAIGFVVVGLRNRRKGRSR